ncbi:MAG: endolytic transglycosylase MltG [Candidatus Nomurabacteria bacterium]|nr:endolytic transglycosylase MltG [Candidatus Nomurabacteria bacterium]
MDFFSDNKRAFSVVALFALFCLFFYFFISPPSNFPAGTVVKIGYGNGLRNVSLKLKNEHVIRSRLVFEALIIIFGGEKRAVSSNYYFENKLSVWEVARRISKGESHLAPIAVTIPEGFNTAEIAGAFAIKLADFNKDNFLFKTKNLEGSLFPDTYFFLTTDNEVDVIKSMSENFDKKILTLRSEITLSGKTEKEILTMASIIEAEAKGDADRGFISGILWKRLSIGMPLQVDSAPETYKTKGLPKNPINNPGLEAIKAAIHPQSSPYLYYLHDKEGVIHYAKSFAEHRRNVLKYLP